MNNSCTRFVVTMATGLLTLAWAGAALAQARISLTDIESRLANIEAAQYAPFKVQIGGGTCNTAAAGSANPRIIIDGNATTGTFLVTSVLVKTADIPLSGFVALSLNSIRIDGTSYDTRTPNLTGSAGGSGVQESFDILGTPVALSGDLNDHTPGANVPHQIVASSGGSSDIDIQLFCRSDVDDLDILNVVVSGWKQSSESVTVTYVPGS